MAWKESPLGDQGGQVRARPDPGCGDSAGVFKRTAYRAPVTLMKDSVRRADSLRDRNSACQCVYRGTWVGDAASRRYRRGTLSLDPGSIGVGSTGVIGRYLDLPLIRDQAFRVAPLITHAAEAEVMAARAIMTTDLTEKHALERRETFSVGGITKGSGMIAPNMGTMRPLSTRTLRSRHGNWENH